MDLAELTLDVFEPRVGEAFAISTEPAGLELVLEAAIALGERPGGRHPFSLTFSGPREPLLPQATYRLGHAELGVLEIFIVPINQSADGARYEAIFT